MISAQDDFDLAIGKLDRVLSVLVNFGREYTKTKPAEQSQNIQDWKRSQLWDEENKQTLKHHAEDMIAAANKILKDLGQVEGTPQPIPKSLDGTRAALQDALKMKAEQLLTPQPVDTVGMEAVRKHAKPIMVDR